MVSIYNLMLRPPDPLTAATFDYSRDRMFYSCDVAGVVAEVRRPAVARPVAAGAPDHGQAAVGAGATVPHLSHVRRSRLAKKCCMTGFSWVPRSVMTPTNW